MVSKRPPEDSIAVPRCDDERQMSTISKTLNKHTGSLSEAEPVQSVLDPLPTCPTNAHLCMILFAQRGDNVPEASSTKPQRCALALHALCAGMFAWHLANPRSKDAEESKPVPGRQGTTSTRHCTTRPCRFAVPSNSCRPSRWSLVGTCIACKLLWAFGGSQTARPWQAPWQEAGANMGAGESNKMSHELYMAREGERKRERERETKRDHVFECYSSEMAF